jgi:hypothetical protein
MSTVARRSDRLISAIPLWGQDIEIDELNSGEAGERSFAARDLPLLRFLCAAISDISNCRRYGTDPGPRLWAASVSSGTTGPSLTCRHSRSDGQIAWCKCEMPDRVDLSGSIAQLAGR